MFLFSPVPGGQTWVLVPRWGGMNLLYFIFLFSSIVHGMYKTINKDLSYFHS